MLSRKLQPEQLRDPAMDLLTQRDVQKAIPMLPTCRDARLCFALTLFRLCLCFACASLRILKSILLCIALICFALHCITLHCCALLCVASHCSALHRLTIALLCFIIAGHQVWIMEGWWSSGISRFDSVDMY